MNKAQPPWQKKSFAIIPWPYSRDGASVMKRRFLTAARKLGYWVAPSWLVGRTQPCLFIGHRRQDKLLKTSRYLVYSVAGMYLEDHFRRIGEVYGDRSFRPEYLVTNQEILDALTRADFVIYQSAWSKRNLDTLCKRPDNTWEIIHNAAPLDVFKPRPDWLDRVPDRPVIGAVGAMRTRPRLEVFFDVVRRLSVRPRLLLVGNLDHYCQSALDKARADPYWRDSITHFKSVPPNTLVNYYQQMDCLLHPVVGDSCPNVVVEALGCGVPVVCPLEGGTSELVGPGGVSVFDTDILYGEMLRAGLAQGIETVLANLPYYRQQARTQAEKNSSMDVVAPRFLKAIGFPV
ncbi:MAG: glycosyltransferase family 4 protein [Magnetococcus sp. YQC-5]